MVALELLEPVTQADKDVIGIALQQLLVRSGADARIWHSFHGAWRRLWRTLAHILNLVI